MSNITSLQNHRVKEAIKLRGHRARIKQRRFLIDGLREIEQALAAGTACQEAFVCPAIVDQDDWQIVQRLQNIGCELLEVNLPVWEKLTFGNRQSGLLVVAGLPDTGLDQLSIQGDALLVVIEGVEKPGNVGAVLRTADGAGADAVIVADGPGDLFNPNTIRASLGTVFRHCLATATSLEALDWLRKHDFTIYVATIGAPQHYHEADFRGRTAIVLGSEAVGVTATWQTRAVQAIQIPMQGFVDSLNVSASAAILLYEAARQRGWRVEG